MADIRLAGKSDVTVAYHQLGSLEFLRSNAYCDLNQIARPFGKRVKDWTRLKGTQELFQAFREDVAYGGAEPFVDRSLRSASTGQFVTGGGLYVHPDIAIQFAIWCSPAFALWVSRQIRHLMTYGEVNLNYREWTTEQVAQGLEFNRDDIKDMYG